MTLDLALAVLAWSAVLALAIIMLSAAFWVARGLAADARKDFNNRQP